MGRMGLMASEVPSLSQGGAALGAGGRRPSGILAGHCRRRSSLIVPLSAFVGRLACEAVYEGIQGDFQAPALGETGRRAASPQSVPRRVSNQHVRIVIQASFAYGSSTVARCAREPQCLEMARFCKRLRLSAFPLAFPGFLEC